MVDNLRLTTPWDSCGQKWMDRTNSLLGSSDQASLCCLHRHLLCVWLGKITLEGLGPVLWARTCPQTFRNMECLPVFHQSRSKTRQRPNLHWTLTTPKQLSLTGCQRQMCFVELSEITRGIYICRVQLLHWCTLSRVTRLTSLKKGKIECCDIQIGGLIAHRPHQQHCGFTLMH